MDEHPTETKAEDKKGKKKMSEVLSWVLTLLGAVALALLIRTVLFEPVRVVGNSMLDTLQNGEIMFVTKLDYLTGDPQRFDVVICHYPGRTENFVKRVVGLPGDHVAVSQGVLLVNGESVQEDYIHYPPRYTLPDTVVPDGCYFVLGDNRANSNDSHVLGPINRSQIVGHVRSVVFPFNRWRGIQ